MSIIIHKCDAFGIFQCIYHDHSNGFLLWNFPENAMEISIDNGDYNDRK